MLTNWKSHLIIGGFDWWGGGQSGTGSGTGLTTKYSKVNLNNNNNSKINKNSAHIQKKEREVMAFPLIRKGLVLIKYVFRPKNRNIMFSTLKHWNNLIFRLIKWYEKGMQWMARHKSRRKDKRLAIYVKNT